MYKAIVIRLFPTKSQARLFWQNAGTSRWTWNWGLDTQKKAYSEGKKFLSVNELKRKFTEVRNDEKFKWLQEVSRQVEANALIELNKAYSQFFRKTAGKPKFKSKGKSKPSFCTRKGIRCPRNDCGELCKRFTEIQRVGFDETVRKI